MANCQKQKISGYILVLFLVSVAASGTEDLDPDLAEGLVALQPVLKGHEIEYR